MSISKTVLACGCAAMKDRVRSLRKFVDQLNEIFAGTITRWFIVLGFCRRVQGLQVFTSSSVFRFLIQFFWKNNSSLSSPLFQPKKSSMRLEAFTVRELNKGALKSSQEIYRIEGNTCSGQCWKVRQSERRRSLRSQLLPRYSVRKVRL